MNSPLQSKKCMDLINTFLNKNKILLEIGSGYSTIDFSNKVKEICSIEHNITWYNNISNLIKKYNIKNINYIFVEPNMDVMTKKSVKYNLDLGLGGGGGKYWEYDMYSKYIEQIGKFNSNFDICFIDGQARMHCYLYVYNYLNNDGIVIIHDFYNIHDRDLLDKLWNFKILFKYYDKIESIEKIGKNKNRGNDVIILKKKNNIKFDINDMYLLDKNIPRY